MRLVAAGAKVITSAQREDYRNTVKQHGFLEADFELEESEATRPVVAITRNRRSVCKIYPAGQGSNWLAEFADDLAKGLDPSSNAARTTTLLQRLTQTAPAFERRYRDRRVQVEGV